MMYQESLQASGKASSTWLKSRSKGSGLLLTQVENGQSFVQAAEASKRLIVIHQDQAWGEKLSPSDSFEEMWQKYPPYCSMQPRVSAAKLGASLAF